MAATPTNRWAYVPTGGGTIVEVTGEVQGRITGAITRSGRSRRPKAPHLACFTSGWRGHPDPDAVYAPYLATIHRYFRVYDDGQAVPAGGSCDKTLTDDTGNSRVLEVKSNILTKDEKDTADLQPIWALATDLKAKWTAAGLGAPGDSWTSMNKVIKDYANANKGTPATWMSILQEWQMMQELEAAIDRLGFSFEQFMRAMELLP